MKIRKKSGGRGCVRLGKMPVMLHLEARTEILEIPSLISYHPPKLIMPLLDKITKSGMLQCDIGKEGGLLLLDRPKGVTKVTICLLYTSDAADE